MNQDTNNPQDLPPEDIYQDSTQSSPAVAATPAKNFVFLAIFVGVLILLVWLFIGGKGGKPDEMAVKTPQILAKPKPIPVIKPPETIDLPPPINVKPDMAPPPTPTEEVKSPFDPKQSPDTVKRFKSSMLIGGGGVFGGTDFGGGGNEKEPPKALTEINDNDPNVGFADSFYNQKEVAFAQARNLGDTSRLITQGKIVESILETPINTDIPGMIRAIVSRDIYAESGKKILIPKGSRLVGTYNTFVIRGNKRVNIIWSRVIRPDGIDVMIRSGGTDQLGRAGVEGNVDNKYTEIFASAFLVSAINIAVGVGTDAMDPNKGNNTTTTNTDGSTTSNSSATHDAALSAVDLFGNAGKNLVDGFLNLKPTITIDQGTRVNVFVNRDLIFPANMGSEIRMIQ
jgi:type IV secretion system protein VirB10